MDRTSEKLTVFFEEPFYVGIFERVSDGKLYVCKVFFGAEPTDAEVYRFLLDRHDGLLFSPAVAAVIKEREMRPKRAKREARKQMENVGIGTKAQRALSLRREQSKSEQKALGRKERETEKLRRFERKQLKRKEKHRGRYPPCVFLSYLNSLFLFRRKNIIFIVFV